MARKKIAVAVANALSPESRVTFATQSAQAFAKADVLSAEAVEAVKKAVDGATFTEYEGVRMTWQKAYMDARGCSEEAAQKAFSRLKSAAEFEKPKAESKDAEKKAAQREEARKALEAKEVPAINVEIAELAIKAAIGDIKAAKEVKALRSELERRNKATSKDSEEKVKALRKDIAESIKALDLEALHKVQALIATLASPVSIATAPKSELEKALGKVNARSKKTASDLEVRDLIRRAVNL